MITCNLPPTGLAPAAGRRIVVALLRAWDVDAATAEDAELVVSELLSNAVLHGAPPIQLRVHHVEGDLVLSVTDAGAGMPAVVAPSAADVLSPDENGRGLRLVDGLARSWAVGEHPDGRGKSVTVHLAAHGGDGDE